MAPTAPRTPALSVVAEEQKTGNPQSSSVQRTGSSDNTTREPLAVFCVSSIVSSRPLHSHPAVRGRDVDAAADAWALLETVRADLRVIGDRLADSVLAFFNKQGAASEMRAASESEQFATQLQLRIDLCDLGAVSVEGCNSRFATIPR